MSILHLAAVVINVILVGGEHGLSLEEWNTVKQETKAIFKRELRGRASKLNFVSPIFEASTTTYTQSNKVEAYYTWRDRLKAEKKKGVWLVVLPPYENNGSRYIAGYARISCFKDLNLSPIVVFLQSKNNNGEDRLLHSAYVVAHEVAHASDATHVDTTTVMNPNPLPWITEFGWLPFDIKSKREIRRCVNS